MVWMVCVVDCRREVAESDENNTFKTDSGFSVKDSSLLADLQAPEASWASATVTEGNAFWVRDRIYNGGAAGAVARERGDDLVPPFKGA